jgi:hypothetical protein
MTSAVSPLFTASIVAARSGPAASAVDFFMRKVEL